MTVKERILITKAHVDAVENEILFSRHIERYALARKYLFGSVCDVACGVGYGAYLCSKNPDVISISGFDIDKATINHAIKNFSSSNVKFFNRDIEDIEGNFDFLLSLETIEHLENPIVISELASRCNVKEVLISFPNKKTTHYNKWHLWDINVEDISKIFKNFYILDEFDFYDSKFVHLIKGKENRLHDEKKWMIK